MSQLTRPHPPLHPTAPAHGTAEPRTLQVRAAGVRLHLLDWGGAGRTLLLLPGLGQSAHVFRGLAPRLGGSVRVIALTPRGHGESDTPADGYALEQLAADARGALDALGVERAALVAHSLGGAVATALAAAHPERVSALVYLDSLCDYAGIGRMLSLCPVKAPALPASVPEGVERLWWRRYHFGGWDAALEADWRARGDAALRARRRELLVDLLDDALAWLEPFEALRAPVLALMAEHTLHSDFPWLAADDPRRGAVERWLREVRIPWRRAAAERLCRGCPTARVRWIAGNHFFFLSRPARTAAEIRRFLLTLPETR